MAQTVTPPPDAPRPLPRRPASTPRPVRPPRLVPQDAVWVVLLAALAVVVAVLSPRAAHGGGAGTTLRVGTVVLLYLLGWRARDRAAGVIAGLLAATSLPFASHAAAAPPDAAFALLVVAALFSFVAGSSLVALALAGLATAARPDGALLGLVLLGLALAQRRRRAGFGALAFVLLAVGGWALRIGLGHAQFPALIVGPRPWLAVWAVTGGMAFVTWLLLPFLAELGEAPRRARWLPVALWTLAYLVVESFIRVGGREATVFGLLPLWCALAGAGLSRLLPALTGDVPLPWVRYGLATLAVLSVLAMRGWAEWPRAHTMSPLPMSPMPQRTLPVAVAPVAHPAPPPPPVPAAPVSAIKPALPVKPAAVLVPAAVAAVALAHHAAAPKPVPKATPKPAAPTTSTAATVGGTAPKPAAKAVARPATAAHPFFRPRTFRRSYRPFYRRRYTRRRRR